jgi:hypothetical protein
VALTTYDVQPLDHRSNTLVSNDVKTPEPIILHIPAFDVFDEEKVLSPNNRDTYNHPTAVRVNRGGEITEVTAAGTKVSAGEEPRKYRGVCIEIDFSDESGLDWTLEFNFHKGNTLVGVLKRQQRLDGDYPDVPEI